LKHPKIWYPLPTSFNPKTPLSNIHKHIFTSIIFIPYFICPYFPLRRLDFGPHLIISTGYHFFSGFFNFYSSSRYFQCWVTECTWPTLQYSLVYVSINVDIEGPFLYPHVYICHVYLLFHENIYKWSF